VDAVNILPSQRESERGRWTSLLLSSRCARRLNFALCAPLKSLGGGYYFRQPFLTGWNLFWNILHTPKGCSLRPEWRAKMVYYENHSERAWERSVFCQFRASGNGVFVVSWRAC